MPETILPNGPAPTPDLPISVHLDGALNAVDLVRRLHAGGLELRRGGEDGYAHITLAEPHVEPQSLTNAIREHVEHQRRQLNKAVATLLGAELIAEHSPELELVTDAVCVGREIVEQVIAALDSVRLNTAKE